MTVYRYRRLSRKEKLKLIKRLHKYTTVKLINELKKPTNTTYMRQKRSIILNELRYRKKNNLIEDEAKLAMSLMFDD